LDRSLEEEKEKEKEIEIEKLWGSHSFVCSCALYPPVLGSIIIEEIFK
jgi:hypothetical protein